ncbi:hypothetical protein FQN52_004095 [Onygenales sp. PD_12]|nr:hypothetical protein FQN52_004095 [Onygenales sp. PD_12]
MSQPQNTPEYRLARSDSKDPTTTCRGIKIDGQRCRRTVAAAQSSPSPSPSKQPVTNPNHNVNDDTTAGLFCWQHKDQAVPVVPLSKTAPAPGSKLKARSSIETLIERVGLLDVNERPRPVSEGRVSGRKNRERMDPLLRPDRHPLQVYDTRRHSVGTPRRHRIQFENAAPSPPSSRKKSSAGRKLVCFLMQVSDDEDIPASRVRPHTGHRRAVSNNESRMTYAPTRPPVQPPFRSADAIRERQPHSTHVHSSHLRVPHPTTPNSRPQTSPTSLSPSPARSNRPSLQGSPASSHSHTETLLSWIPSTLSPITTSTLLKELSEPISDADEPGYIYMCWLTPATSTPAPPPELASSLIPPSQTNGTQNSPHRTSEIMRSAGIAPKKVHDPQQNAATDTIILKIGRAGNVHRRMNQWKEQCAHNLTLIRYYPYVPSSPAVHSGAPIPPRKVPHTHKVERLVHLELADRRVKLLEPCECCGRKHKEWFEIRADREQLKVVDECVRRWVRWSEMAGGGGSQ